MALRYGYFDSDIIGVDDEGMPILDRAETSDLFAILLDNLLSDGVLPQLSTCFQVVASNNGLSIDIQPGFAMVRGRFCYDDEVETITIEAAPVTYNRIDRVVLRCNYLMRTIEIILKTGREAANPLPPSLIRPAAGDYYELCLADIYLTAGQQLITQSSITDMRANPSVCGYLTWLGGSYMGGMSADAGYWEYHEANEELAYTSEASGCKAEYDAESETLILPGSSGGGSVDVAAVAEQAAAIVQENLHELSAEDVRGYFSKQ